MAIKSQLTTVNICINISHQLHDKNSRLRTLLLDAESKNSEITIKYIVFQDGVGETECTSPLSRDAGSFS